MTCSYFEVIPHVSPSFLPHKVKWDRATVYPLADDKRFLSTDKSPPSWDVMIQQTSSSWCQFEKTSLSQAWILSFLSTGHRKLPSDNRHHWMGRNSYPGDIGAVGVEPPCSYNLTCMFRSYSRLISYITTSIWWWIIFSHLVSFMVWCIRYCLVLRSLDVLWGQNPQSLEASQEQFFWRRLVTV